MKIQPIPITSVISEIITYLQKKPDVFHQVDSIIGLGLAIQMVNLP